MDIVNHIHCGCALNNSYVKNKILSSLSSCANPELYSLFLKNKVLFFSLLVVVVVMWLAQVELQIEFFFLPSLLLRW